MSQRYAGLLVGGACAGQWVESPSPQITKVVNAGPLRTVGTSERLAETSFTHETYIWIEVPFSGKRGAEVFSLFRHHTLESMADVMRELMTNYRPIQPVRG